tara:strand:+ start:6109 stop:7887 length:1779 start_codon:yes stop_codon:yes gene_type:complete
MKQHLTLGVFLAMTAWLSAQVLIPVTFQVDMSNETVSPDGVYLAGSFQAWDPTATMLSDDDLDNVYEVTLDVEPGMLEFKFLNGPGWDYAEDVPPTCQVEVAGNDNRFLYVDEMQTEASMHVCFASCAACGLNSVRLRVDMSLEAAISPNGVHVAGDFQGWDPAVNPLQDLDEDGIWETVVSFDTTGLGSTILFKFINGNAWTNPTENVEDETCGDGFGNRTMALTSTNDVLYGDLATGGAPCYNACGTCVSPTEVTLRVDMTSQETVSVNGVHVAGSFQGWSANATPLSDDDGDGIWEVTLGMAPGEYEFKFINGNDWSGNGDGNVDNELVVGDCAAEGTDNRALSVGSDPVLYEVCYNACELGCVENPDPADITFRVDMSEEDVNANGVWVIGNFTTPNWQAGGMQMTDDDADGVYEVTANVSGGVTVLYKFVNGDPSTGDNGIDYLEESGVHVDAEGNELGNFELDGCGLANGFGAYNRIHERSGTAEILEATCYNKCTTCVVSVDELILNAMAIYPNPFVHELNVQFVKFTLGGSLELRDMTGRLVRSDFLSQGTNRIQWSTSDLEAGTYTLSLVGDVNIPAQLIVKH